MKSLKLNVGDFGDDVAQLHEILKQQGIEVAAEEVKRQFFGPATREAVQNFQRQQGLNDSGELNRETAVLLKPSELRGSIFARETIPLSRREEPTALINASLQNIFSVRGHVLSTDGTPLDGVQVQALHKGFRTDDVPLGKAVKTNDSGEYQITYSIDAVRNQERERVNLFVHAFAYDENNNLTFIASSEDAVLFNAEPKATIDLVVEPERYREPAKYDRIRRDLSFKLREIPLTELTEEEIPYLSAETNLESQDVEVMVQAAKVAKTIQESYDLNVKPEIFYALASQDIPITSLTDVVSQDRQVLRRALETALVGNTIHEEGDTDALIEETLNNFITVSVKDHLDGNLGALLGTSPQLIEKDIQEAYIKESLTYEGDPDGFWEHLSQNDKFTNEVTLKDLQFTLELGELTQGYLPVIEVLQAELRKGETPPTLRHLANWNLIYFFKL